MKTKVCSFFVLFAIAAVMVSSTPAAFADRSEVTISTADTDLDTPDACSNLKQVVTPQVL